MESGRIRFKTDEEKEAEKKAARNVAYELWGEDNKIIGGVSHVILQRFFYFLYIEVSEKIITHFFVNKK